MCLSHNGLLKQNFFNQPLALCLILIKPDFIIGLSYYSIALTLYNQGHDQSDPILPLWATFLQEQVLYSISILTQVLLLTSGIYHLRVITKGTLSMKKTSPITQTEFLSSELYGAVFVL